MNETLRSNFYGKNWEYDKCEPYSIFLSQGNYPIKGLHYMLKAMPMILEQYPDAKITVVDTLMVSLGESIMVIRANELKEKGINTEILEDKKFKEFKSKI